MKVKRYPTNVISSLEDFLKYLDKFITRGLKMYLNKKFENVICHFFQKTDKLFEKYGLSKFSGVRIPIKYAVPIAMSEYPEKSNNIYKE
jgi:hypothetical protein